MHHWSDQNLFPVKVQVGPRVSQRGGTLHLPTKVTYTPLRGSLCSLSLLQQEQH